MKSIRIYGVWAAVLVGLAAGRLSGQSQLRTLYGDQNLIVSGEHAGNQFRTTFYNDGEWGNNRNSTGDIGGEWPIGSGHIYMVDGNPFVGSEVIDEEGQLRHITSTVRSIASAPRARTPRATAVRTASTGGRSCRCGGSPTRPRPRR